MKQNNQYSVGARDSSVGRLVTTGFKRNGNVAARTNTSIPVGCRLQLHPGENPLQSFKASGVSETQVELQLRHLVAPSGEPGSRQAAVLSCFPRSPGGQRGQSQRSTAAEEFASLRRSSNSRLVQNTLNKVCSVHRVSLQRKPAITEEKQIHLYLQPHSLYLTAKLSTLEQISKPFKSRPASLIIY